MRFATFRASAPPFSGATSSSRNDSFVSSPFSTDISSSTIRAVAPRSSSTTTLRLRVLSRATGSSDALPASAVVSAPVITPRRPRAALGLELVRGEAQAPDAAPALDPPGEDDVGPAEHAVGRVEVGRLEDVLFGGEAEVGKRETRPGQQALDPRGHARIVYAKCSGFRVVNDW